MGLDRWMRRLIGERERVSDDVQSCVPDSVGVACALCSNSGRREELQVNKCEWVWSFIGCHVVAPSDMMDNRVAAIKESLRGAGLEGQVR